MTVLVPDHLTPVLVPGKCEHCEEERARWRHENDQLVCSICYLPKLNLNEFKQDLQAESGRSYDLGKVSDADDLLGSLVLTTRLIQAST